MTTGAKRTLALALVALGSVWICFAQMIQTAMPAAVASEAPDRHLKGKDNMTQEETYQFAFAVARDVRDRSPNALLGLAPILFGVWLLSRRRENLERKMPHENATRTV